MTMTVDAVTAGSALIGPDGDSSLDLAGHLKSYGPLLLPSGDDVVELAAKSGLTGHGGAGFPLWRKLNAVRDARGRPIVVANGAEGEPASAKDRWLLARRPHLVLDGLQLAARAVGSREAVLYVNARTSVPLLEKRLRERPREHTRVELVVAPDAFIAGEESAVANALSGGVAIPRFKSPRVVERGVRNRPTLVSNVETLALLALICRRGAGWFREIGTADQPGTMLFSVGGAVARPGIVQAAHGTALTGVLDLAGGSTQPLQAVLLGGYHGAWLTAAEAASARLSRSDLAPLSASPGAGVVVALGQGVCGLAEMSRVISYLARESAGQCGPCLNGLPRMAAQVKALATGNADRRTFSEIERLAGLVAGRGACHHPDGSVRFVRSGLRVFADEIARHLQGRCNRTTDEIVWPT